MTDRLRVGTRRSPLARAQTDLVLRRLARNAPGVAFTVNPIDTSGDRDRAVSTSPDFTDAIDRALRRGEVDLAVHSAKDLPVRLDDSLELVACPRRADPRDCLVVAPGLRAASLPRGARVGSSSLRRRAQLLRERPDLDVVEVRGNVDTRIGLVRSGAVDAVILAVAGLDRLGRRAKIGRILPTTSFVPAPAQGALAVVARSGDRAARSVASAIDDRRARASVTAERAFAAALGGDCQVPLGALASVRGDRLHLVGEVLSPDGRRSIRVRNVGALTRPAPLGDRLGRALVDRGGLELIPFPGR